uniref:DUF148 domain-containing protein n=1 Tax=Steinernema glaseri TaxID=37863 RepID=A0A1I7YMU3_9BILA
MKFLIAIVALLAVAYCEEAPAAEVEAVGPIAGADVVHHEHHKGKGFIPPLIEKAIEGFSKDGKKAFGETIKTAMETRKDGKPFTQEQFMTEFSSKAPKQDADNLKAAKTELENAVSKLPQAEQNAYNLGAKLFDSGIPTAAALQEFAKSIQALEPAQLTELANLAPFAKKFSEEKENFQKALDGTLEFGKKPKA